MSQPITAQLLALEQEVASIKVRLADLHTTRNQTLEEVAQAIEAMPCFGHDTTASFAIYIREMKR